MKTFPSSKHSGITLISLLIATVLGIFIMAAAGQVYLSSQAAYSLRSSVSAVSENGRYALDDIRRTLAMTGRGISAAQKAFGEIDSSGISDAGTSLSNSDIIAVRFAEGSSCAGDVSGISLIRIKVVNNILICELNGVEVPLVSGVHLMRVLYGIMDNPLTNSSANRYLTADAVAAAGAWRDVVAMRVGLVVSSDNETLPVHMRDASVKDINLMGMTFTPPDAEHLFRAVTTTVVLRNLNPIISKQ